MRYRNPVLPGFHPDPSVCKVGDTFYLATSSFHYFPGIPIHQSRDLVHWELIGHGITSSEQLDLSGTPASRGLFAPTIREHGGRFYITCTEVDRLENFVIAADRPEGPWSVPLSLSQGGIDPSLFFDDDGAVYLCTGGDGIALSVIDPDSGVILEGPKRVCYGSGGRWPEGPHLYKRGGLYYLLLAEGGTEYGHMATIFRAASPWGPWEGCPRNPILSHRDDAGSPIQCVGHGDIVEDSAGNSWLFCLGVRPIGPQLHNLGRETFLAPIVWDESGWPVVGKDGRLGLEMEGPLEKLWPGALPGTRGMPWPDVRVPEGKLQTRPRGGAPEGALLLDVGARSKFPSGPGSGSNPIETAEPATARNVVGVDTGWRDTFAGPTLAREWSFLRERPLGMVVFRDGGGLVLRGEAQGLSDEAATPAFIGRPQVAFDCVFEANLDFKPEIEGAEAGVAAYYDDSYHYEAFVTRRGGRSVVCFRKRVHDIVVEGAPVFLPEEGKLRLRIIASRERYVFSCECGIFRSELGAGMTAGLCTEGTWRQTFTGVFFGLYCQRGVAFFSGASCVDSGGGR